MTATPGTIPALTSYQPGALPVVGTEAIEIVNTTNATSAASFSMLLTDVVGKMPSVMSQANPASGDYFAFFQTSSGLPKATLVGNLSVPAGNVVVGGTLGQIYFKNSGTNFDASWTTVIPNLTITNLTATTGTIATLVAGTGTITTSVITNLTVTNLTATVATIPTLVANTATIGTAVVTNLTVTTGTVTNLTVTTQTVTTLNATNLTTSVATAANLSMTTGTATSLFVSSLTATNATVTGNIVVAGSASLGAPLTVPNGGIATTTLGTVAVLIGGANNTAPVSTVPATTAGMVLTSNGTTTAPSWFGSMVLLNTISPAGLTTAFDNSSMTATYRDYMVMFENLCPTLNTVILQMQVATVGSTFISGNYVSLVNNITGGVSTTDTSTTLILLTGIKGTTSVATATTAGVSGYMFFQNPTGTNLFKQFNGDLSYQSTNAAGALSTSNMSRVNFAGTFAGTTSAITSLGFSFSAGTIATGVIKVWGLV